MADESVRRRERILAAAEALRGIPYRLDPPPDGVNTLDCSLFVLTAYRAAGMPFSGDVRTAEQIRQACEPVGDWTAVQPGDLLFFEHTYEPSELPGPDGRVASHIGISLGAGTGQMWDAHETTSGPRPSGAGLTDISTAYWQDHIFEARRPQQVVEIPASVRYRVTDAGVRLRAAPGTSKTVLVQDLGANTILESLEAQLVAADGHRWRHVRTPHGMVGWVADSFLALASDSGVSGGGNAALTAATDHRFSFAELWQTIEAAAAKHGADARVIAAIMAQESSFVNWRVHADKTGHGLFGLDDNGLLPDFETWSGLSCGRGEAGVSIPPALQIEFCALKIATLTAQFGSPITAARVWHRGAGGWQDARGDQYEALIRDHLQRLFP